MATAIKAIPTLKGKEAREFLRHAEEAERWITFPNIRQHFLRRHIVEHDGLQSCYRVGLCSVLNHSAHSSASKAMSFM
jgi:hypothetical protein